MFLRRHRPVGDAKGGSMRIAFASKGDNRESMLDERFGRAARIVVVDTDSGTVESIDNTAGISAAQGAGIQAAERVANLGVEALVTMHCGPKAFAVLKRAGVEVWSAPSCTVGEALDMHREGRLARLSEADVDTHW